MGVVVRRYIDFLILLIPSSCICSFCSIPTFLFIFLMFVGLVPVHFCNLFNNISRSSYKQTYQRLRASHGSRMKGCT